MDNCPNCQRKLISHTSARCNWCGHEINDPDYQAQARVQRELFFAQQAAHDAQSLIWSQQNIANGADSFGIMPVNGYLGDVQRRAQMASARRAAVDAAVQQAASAQTAIEAAHSPAFGTEPEPVQGSSDTGPEESPRNADTGRFGHLEF
jgi:hypothetical protein